MTLIHLFAKHWWHDKNKYHVRITSQNQYNIIKYNELLCIIQVLLSKENWKRKEICRDETKYDIKFT